ncbi:hypothetical protein F8388_005285, partial [Cannabis sativa]
NLSLKAAEQLVSIELDPAKLTPANTRFQRGSSSIRRRFRTDDVALTPPAGVSYVSTPLMEEDEIVDGDFYLLAKNLILGIYYDDLYDVCYWLRLEIAMPLYAGEKLKEEETIELEGPLGKSSAFLWRGRYRHFENGTIDPFGLYLYGIVLKEEGNENLACSVLVESVNNNPWNWDAWSKLQSLCTTIDMLNNLNLNNHWMKDFFLASAYQEIRMHNESLAKYEYLQGTFSFSNYIQAQIAKAQYSLRDFEVVEAIFEELLRNDPYRVEDMDMYSNECFAALSFLAHRVFMTDKYRPESCCIIGNYYSLKGQHEKSVLYFERALKLDKNYLSAWTLMGHEYVEMKNTPAAVDAYRRAIDINSCDYRAWYGLGQAYEMMGMHYYALHYFKKSVFLQPNDSRLWIAMARCYETDQLRMLDEAIKCYKRAVNGNDREAIALRQLAKLHHELGRSEEAAFYYKMDLERMKDEDREGPNMVEALFFLATHYKNVKRFEEAEVYCTRLLDYNGPVSSNIVILS